MSGPHWRKIDNACWYAEDWGMAVRSKRGWFASASGYRAKLVDPIVGPFKTRQEAFAAFEAAKLAAHEARS